MLAQTDNQTCGGVGHISRECPSGGGGGGQRSFGAPGGFSGPKKCYVSYHSPFRETSPADIQNCGQEGHISRECPQEAGRTVSSVSSLLTLKLISSATTVVRSDTSLPPAPTLVVPRLPPPKRRFDIFDSTLPSPSPPFFTFLASPLVQFSQSFPKFQVSQ